MIPQKQLTLADIFENCQDIFESDKPQFLTLLENHIDLDEIIPVSFYNHYYEATGRNRKYSLNAMLWALIIQRLFQSLLIPFYSSFFIIPDISGNSVVFPKLLMLLKSHTLSRIFYRTYNRFLINLLMWPN